MTNAPDTNQRRVAIVTGAASGIGKAIAIRLAKDGYNVVLSDLPSQSQRTDEVIAQILEDEPRRVCGMDYGPVNITCDVTKEDQVQHLVDETVRIFGRLDCMVANAGITACELLAEVTLEDYNRIMNVNTTGTLLCYRTAAKAMIACNTTHGGRLIGACSHAGKHGVPILGAYSASKFAIRSLTQTAAREFGSTGITVNAYAPSFIDTPMVDSAKADVKRILGISGDVFIQQIVQQSALKRLGSVQDVANLVSFLASTESGFITGQCISVDGGNNMD